jgi:hypothetical protein
LLTVLGTGNLHWTIPPIDGDEVAALESMEWSCSLDLADKEDVGVDMVAAAIRTTPQRVTQMINVALEKLRDANQFTAEDLNV